MSLPELANDYQVTVSKKDDIYDITLELEFISEIDDRKEEIHNTKNAGKV